MAESVVMVTGEVVEVSAVGGRRAPKAVVGGVRRIQQGAAVRRAPWKATARRGRRHRRAVHVHAGVLLLPFGTSVLEPNLHLKLI